MKLGLLLLLTFFSHFAFGQNEEEINIDEELAQVAELNPLQKITDLGYKEIDFNALQDERVVLILQDVFKNSPLMKMQPDEIKEMILKQSEGKFFYNYLKNSPKLLKTVIEILQDSKALPSMLGLLTKKKEMEIFFFFSIGLIIATWLVKRFWLKKKKKWSGSKKFLVSLLISFASTSISLGVFYYLFYDEVAPVTNIAVTNWRRRNLP